jgi:small subunit ribosomal protein S20
MPVKSAAFKALRQNRTARTRNLITKLALKKLAVRLRKAYTAKKLDEAKTITTEYTRALDKAVKRGILHRNTAGRKKSRLAAQLQKSSKA